MIYLATLAANGARFTREIAKQLRPGYKPTLMGDPNLAAFSAAYRTGYDVEPPLLSEGAYDATYLIAYALERAGRPDRDAVRGGLRDMSGPPGQRVGVSKWAEGLAALRADGDVDYDGAAGPIDWDDSGEVTFDRAPPSYVIYELHGGQLAIVEELAASPR